MTQETAAQFHHFKATLVAIVGTQPQWRACCRQSFHIRLTFENMRIYYQKSLSIHCAEALQYPIDIHKQICSNSVPISSYFSRNSGPTAIVTNKPPEARSFNTPEKRAHL